MSLSIVFGYMGFALDRDYILSWDSDAQAQHIEWLSEQPQPTPEEIEAARLPALRDAVKLKVRAECERRQFVVPLPHAVGQTTYLFQMDRDSRGRYAFLQGFVPLFLLQGMTTASPLIDPVTQSPVTWWTKNPDPGGANIPVTMTIGQFIGMVQAGAAREMALDAAYRAHLVAAALLDDPLEYDYSGGWPD